MLVAFGVMLCGPALAAQADRDDDEIESPEVRNIRLQGVKLMDKDELLKNIKTDESSCNALLVKVFCLFTKSRFVYTRRYLDRKEFARDVVRIRAFYWKRGYREAKVDTAIVSRGEKKVEVRFLIQEGRPTVVTRIAVARPESLLSVKEMRKMVVLRSGRAFDQLKLDSSIVRLRLAMWDKGYADAEVTADSITVSPTDRTAQVHIAINPKWRTTIGEIRINGNRDVSKRTIRSSLYFKPGDAFRREDLLLSQRRLYQTNMFKRAAIVHPPEGDSIKTIEVTVQEAPLRDVRASVGFSTYDFFLIDGRYTQYNFFGRGRRLGVHGALGNLGAGQLNGRSIFRDVFRGFDGDRSPYERPNWLASADLQQPAFFFSPKNSGGIGVFAHRRSAPGIYVDRGFGTSATFTRELRVRAPLSGTYRFEITRVEAAEVYFCVNFGVCEDTTIAALRSRQRLSPVGLSGSIDRSNDLLNPRRGYTARGEIEHASRFTISDFRYNRATVDGAAYRPVGRRGALAGHVRLGWVRALQSTEQALGAENVLHPRKRFYAGGAQSVRGYGENQLGPRVLTISPDTLRGRTVSGVGVTTFTRCDPSIPIQECDPDMLDDNAFTPRPTGGNSVAEASVELRFPIWQNLGGAVFIDGAYVGEGALKAVKNGTAALTPGFGIRYYSPVGPIRVDVGFNPLLQERYTVITQSDADSSRADIVTLNKQRDEHPKNLERGFRRLLQRMTLHLSIGQAY